jgi:two-component system, OmpR family, sensor kinase
VKHYFVTRWLGLIGFAILVVGLLAAFLARLLLPPSLLEFGFEADPANLLVILVLIASAVPLAVAVLLGWRDGQMRQALVRQAAALETERRRFIQRLDHELKNPLTAIQVQLDNLQAADGNRGSIGDVRAQVDRLAHLTRGLRRLADLETRPLELERIQIGELLHEVIDLLQRPDRLALDIQRVPWPIPPIEGDRELLLMVFRNLADNALKYSSAGVQVRARHTSGALVVEVIDTGRGIPTEELRLVTEELYRGSNTRDVSGSGLGLAIVQRIVERHSGKLEVRSRPGQGTITTVQLPYDQITPR